jgi:hypothetical protein
MSALLFPLYGFACWLIIKGLVDACASVIKYYGSRDRRYPNVPINWRDSK